MGKEQFFTRAKANEGIKLPLHDPATGEKTEHWLRILGRDSDTFRAEEAASRRRTADALRELAPGDKAGALAKLREAEPAEMRQLVASLVAEWSFEGKCTRDAVVAFLVEAPQIQDAIDEVATKRALFLRGASSSSPSSPSTNSDSTSAPKEAAKAPEPA